MKNLLAILVIAVACYLIVNRDALLHKPAAEANDPTAAMEKLVRSFPRQTTSNNGEAMGLSDVSFDVRKTDSLVNPIVGTIHFYNTIDYRMDFHWKSGKWVFTRLIASYNGSENDITNGSGGRELLGSAPMRAFLEKGGSAPVQ